MKKQVFINCSIIENKRTGVEVYSKFIIINLIKCLKERNIPYVLASFNNLAQPVLNEEIRIFELPLLLNILSLNNATLKRILWNTFILHKISNQFEIVYSPSTHGSPFLSNQYLTIHDLIAYSFPLQHVFQYFYYRIYLPLFIRNKNHFIAISDYTKDQMQYYHKVQDDMIDVVYNGTNHFDYLIYKNDSISKLNIPVNYFITVGASYSHKNIITILRVAERLSEYNINFVIIGRPSNYYKKVKKQVFKNNLENIFFLENVNDADLVSLYKNSLGNLYLSLNEGFGFPPFEAAYQKTISIVSDTKFFRNIYKDSVVYVDPIDIIKISETLLAIFNGKYLFDFNPSDLLNQYTWERASKELSSILLKPHIVYN